MFMSIFDSVMDNLWQTLLPIILTLDLLSENGRMMWALFTSTLWWWPLSCNTVLGTCHIKPANLHVQQSFGSGGTDISCHITVKIQMGRLLVRPLWCCWNGGLQFSKGVGLGWESLKAAKWWNLLFMTLDLQVTEQTALGLQFVFHMLDSNVWCYMSICGPPQVQVCHILVDMHFIINQCICWLALTWVDPTHVRQLTKYVS